MDFLIRGARIEDLEKLYDLSSQFTLLNLPSDRKVLTGKIEKSLLSFSGKLERMTSEYLFVVEELSTGALVGSSQIIGQKGTLDWPNYAFKVLKRSRYSEDLSIGFIHTVLSLREETAGPTEIGGLLVDKGYRRRKEKIGKQMSLVRFLYIGMEADRFDENLHVEFAPPFTDEGKSLFWEALGRKFTGLAYDEADLLSRHNKEFIRKLYPEADLYLTLLDQQVRLVFGKVGIETLPALKLLEEMGFQYSEEIDPFDGGPHYNAKTSEIEMIDKVKTYILSERGGLVYNKRGLLGSTSSGEFRACYLSYFIEDGKVYLPMNYRESLSIDVGETVSILPVDF